MKVKRVTILKNIIERDLEDASSAYNHSLKDSKTDSKLNNWFDELDLNQKVEIFNNQSLYE